MAGDPYLILVEDLDQFPGPEPEDPDLTEEEARSRPVFPDHIRPRLDPLEQDILDLLEKGLTQGQIGRILDLSQAGISYRLRRAVERLRFWLAFDELILPMEDIRAKLWTLRLSPQSCERAALYCHLESQCLVAQTLGNCNQNMVRTSILTVIKHLKKQPPEDELAARILALFRLIQTQGSARKLGYSQQMQRMRQSRGSRVKPNELNPDSYVIQQTPDGAECVSRETQLNRLSDLA